MTSSITKSIQLAGVVVAVIAGLFASEKALVEPGSFVTRAHAIIGRPLTPMSYAGVARRTTARAVTAGAVATGVAVGAAAAPVVVAPACVQAVDAYGRIYMRCP
ncbi:hypothetical protein ABIC08_008580 [Bradyrhizobium sp. RT9b]|uniref:hypothetical protein n=1 Tax=unclassified Bradyrhizobium TaxID=2631580 RepID=UPI001FF972C4|nr:hypothetical protein [Bradyrhizobium sp. 61]MCK1281101.1 hypothetical protein [Bradyrhizobium sp. 61]